MVTTSVRKGALRAPVLFVFGLLLASAVAVLTDRTAAIYAPLSVSFDWMKDKDRLQLRPLTPLTEAERADAAAAWSYIKNNTRTETGLVDSVAGFPSTTLWDQGSYLLALVSAHRLGMVDDEEFNRRITNWMMSFQRIGLFEGTLPNKAYNTQTLAITDYNNVAQPEGIGWSALDVARLLSAFRVVERHAPRHSPSIQKVVARWDLTALAAEGEMIGADRNEGATLYLQEGRIGYEQYGARAAALWGLDVSQAMSAARFLDWTTVGSVRVPSDRRVHNSFGAITPILSEPYFLQALEFGLDRESLMIASQVYAAQEARFTDTGILTMVSEDHLDRMPHFAYSSVVGNGLEWPVLTETGENFPELRTISTKAAFAWDALFGTKYTAEVVKKLRPIADPENGWPAGLYESTGEINQILTLNTNAVILQALHRKAFGALMAHR